MHMKISSAKLRIAAILSRGGEYNFVVDKQQAT